MAASAGRRDEAGGRPGFHCSGRDFSSYLGERLLGKFDGLGERELHLYALDDQSAQTLVSYHENLHHDLHWSTAWGVFAGMAGLLAEADVQSAHMRPLAAFANSSCRLVHEIFSTTLSCGVIGIDRGRELLAGNSLYLSYLDQGLRLAGPEHWPWQFRDTALQALIRALMQPAVIKDLAGQEFGQVSVRALARPENLPDQRLLAVSAAAGEWWEDVYAELAAAYPDRGGDLGGSQRRVLPGGATANNRLVAWEDEVLRPRLRAVAAQRLRECGFAVLDDADYAQVIETAVGRLRSAGAAGRFVILRETRMTSLETLSAERESVVIHQTPAQVIARTPAELRERPQEFFFAASEAVPQLLAVFLGPPVLRRQFAGLTGLALDGPAVLAVAGRPSLTGQADRVLPLMLFRPGCEPGQLPALFAGAKVITLTTLATIWEPERQQQVAGLESLYILIDVPLNLQINTWLDNGQTVRFRAVELHGGPSVRCAVFGLDQLPGCRFLCYRSEAAWGELMHMLDQHAQAGRLGPALQVDKEQQAEIGMVASWLMSAWWRFGEVDF